MTDDDIVSLEHWIDSYGLDYVLDALAKISHAKAEHVLIVWGDKGLAQRWERNAAKLEACAANLAPTQFTR